MKDRLDLHDYRTLGVTTCKRCGSEHIEACAVMCRAFVHCNDCKAVTYLEAYGVKAEQMRPLYMGAPA